MLPEPCFPPAVSSRTRARQCASPAVLSHPDAGSLMQGPKSEAELVVEGPAGESA